MWRKDLTNYVITEGRKKTMGESIGHTSLVYNESYSTIKTVQQWSACLRNT